MNLKYTIIIMASVALFSCSKAEEGAVGSADQNGIDGTDGAAGTDG